MRNIGISLQFERLNRAFYEEMAEAGISSAEVSVNPMYYPTLNVKKIGREMVDAGITPWSFHLPFTPFATLNPASPDPDVRRLTVQYDSSLMSRAADAGFSRFVIHASGEPNAPEDRPTLFKCAADTLQKLADHAASLGGVLAVECLPRTCIGNCHEEILALIGDHPAMGVCFDTNHLTSEDDVEFLRAVAPRLITTHVSDYDLIDERHLLPGEGKVDWIALMKEFDAVGYEGAFLYEVAYTSGKYVEREKPLSARDFYENAAILHAGKVPPPHDRVLI